MTVTNEHIDEKIEKILAEYQQVRQMVASGTNDEDIKIKLKVEHIFAEERAMKSLQAEALPCPCCGSLDLWFHYDVRGSRKVGDTYLIDDVYAQIMCNVCTLNTIGGEPIFNNDHKISRMVNTLLVWNRRKSLDK